MVYDSENQTKSKQKYEDIVYNYEEGYHRKKINRSEQKRKV